MNKWNAMRELPIDKATKKGKHQLFGSRFFSNENCLFIYCVCVRLRCKEKGNNKIRNQKIVTAMQTEPKQ